MQEGHRHRGVDRRNRHRTHLLARRLVEGVESRSYTWPAASTTTRTAPPTAPRAATATAPGAVDHERLRGDHLGLTAECGHAWQRHAGEQRIGRGLVAPLVAVRHPPLLVARVQIVRRDAAQLLRLENRDA